MVKVACRSRVALATISLDGKLIGGASTPGKTLPNLEAADELLLSVKPVILGGLKAPTLSCDLDGIGLGFLPKDLCFKLLSVTSARGTLLLRYQRI
jgi:riboflavin biosynthesis pyrimidine reductase